LSTGRRGHGEGSIHKRADGRWAATIDLVWENGKRRRKSLYGKTRADVAERLRQLQQQSAQGLPLPDERRRVADYLEWWATDVLPGTVKESTADGYRYMLDRYVVPHVGRVTLAKLGPQHVQSMLRSLEADGLAPARRQARAILRRALGHAERWGFVARNAAALVDAPGLNGSKIDDVLSVDEAHALLRAAAGTPHEALVSVALAVGLRRGEALALRWDDLDLERGNLTVRATLKRRPGKGLILDTPKTARGRRTIPLPGVSVTALRDHRRAQAAKRLAAGPEWRDTGHVFATPIGTPLDPDNLTKHFHALCDRAGIPRRRFHALRHSAATLMLAAGTPLEVISKTLGHAGYAITADVYARVVPELQREAADAMNRVLAQGS